MRTVWGFCLMAALALSAENGLAQIIEYSFNGSPGLSPSLNHSNIVATSLSDVGGHQPETSGGQLRSYNWTTSATVDPSTGYLAFSLTPHEGYALNLDSIQFDYRRGIPPLGDTARQYELRTFRDSVGLELHGSGVYAGTSRVTDETVNLNNLRGVTESIEFRIYNFDAIASGNGEYIQHDNLQVFGTVSAVPEPSQYAAAFGVLLVGFAAFRRYRRRVEA